MFEFVQKLKLNSCRGWINTTLAGLMARGVVTVSLLAGAGCQMANDCGFVRGWVDVNSTGSPAAFVEKIRTNDFRTAAPRNVLHDAKIIEFQRDCFGLQPEIFEVFPIEEVEPQVQQTSADFQQSAHVGKSASRHTEQRSVKPAGAWLF